MPGLPAGGPRTATLLLTAVAAVWGSTFFLIKDLVRTIPSADFLAVRFAIAAIVMAAVFHRQLRSLTRREVRFGLVLGLLYGAAQLLQTVGLEHTDASVSGFVTGTYVVLTPLFAAIILRDRVPGVTWIAATLALAGIGVLSLRGASFGFGESLTLGAAAVYAVHIITLGRWTTPESAVGLATLQAGVITVVSGLGALPDGITLPSGTGQWSSMLYMALVAGGGALWAQTWAQSQLSATTAAIVMALEPVFAALFAVGFGGETLTGRILLGGALILTAMYLVELRGSRSVKDPPGVTIPAEAPAADP